MKKNVCIQDHRVDNLYLFFNYIMGAMRELLPTWDDILKGPSVVLNMDSASDRLPIIMKRIQDAGFTNIQRLPAIDGRAQDMKVLWKQNTANNPSWKFDSDGQAACTLTHMLIWRDMIIKKIPYLTVFEDDVMFHKDWEFLAPQFYEQTSKDLDILYLGSQFGAIPSEPKVMKRSLFCTHAYVVTLQGAKKLHDMMYYAPDIYVIDCMIKNMLMDIPSPHLKWQCWNATMNHDEGRHNAHECRNDGLVYQDSSFETNIHNQKS